MKKLVTALFGPRFGPKPYGFVGPHETLAALNPLQKLAPPAVGGVPIGLDDDGNMFYLDFHRLQRDKIIAGPVCQIMGEKDAGKTTLAMLIAMRSSHLMARPSLERRRIGIDDTRRNPDAEGIFVPEYQNLAEYLGGEHVDLSAVGINVLEPELKMVPHEQLLLLTGLIELSSNERMSQGESQALLYALNSMRERMPKSASLSLLRVMLETIKFDEFTRQFDHLRHEVRDTINPVELDDFDMIVGPTDNLQHTNTRNEDFEHNCALVGAKVEGLLSKYGRLFSERGNLYQILSRPVATLNFTGLGDSLDLVEMLIWAVRSSATNRGDNSLMTHLEIHDENLGRLESPIYARHLLRRIALIRSTGTIIIRTGHRFTDLNTLDTDIRFGANLRGLAEAAMRHTQVWFIGKLPRDQHDLLQEIVRPLPRSILDRLPLLPQGQFLTVLGQTWPPFFVNTQNLLTPDELRVSQTNWAMEHMAGTI